MKIILGSSSKWRREILQKMGYQFEVLAPEIDEKTIREKDPEKLTIAIARAKAQALLEKLKEPAILITSDQVISWKGQIREKPVDEREARYFLESSSEAPACTVTAVVVTNTKSGQNFEGVDIAKIWFKPIPEKIIDQLIAEGEVYQCSGGFAHEHPLLRDFIEKIEGTEDSISGFPSELVGELLKQALNS